MAKNILVISPHPDDLEIGCAGTISKFLDAGHSVEVILTVKPSVEINANRNESIVKRELIRSEQFMGVEYKVYNTPIAGNGRPQLSSNNVTITEIENLLEKDHYDLLITSDPGDYHQDHRNTFQIANSICRGARINELWTMQIPPYSHRNESFRPNVAVNISEYWDKKEKLLRCYESYITDEIINTISSLNQYNAGAIGVEYAEVFEQKFKYIK